MCEMCTVANIIELNITITTVIFIQVLQLLDSLGLGQYKDGFSREQIDGALMVDLDDEILEYELMVQSKLHRLKLMRVINGKQSTRTPQPSPSRLQQSN